jgi:hypothetical protein
MKKYNVDITHPVTHCHNVEAENEDDAKQMALEGEGYIRTEDLDYKIEIEITEGWDL